MKPVRSKVVDLMEQYVLTDGLIYTRDLQTFLYIANNDRELSILLRMLYKFCSQSEQSSYRVGPELLRMCFCLEKLDFAYKLYTDVKLRKLFEKIRSAQILMEMLLQKKEYDMLFHTFDSLISDYDFSDGLNSVITNIIFGACFEINTRESYNKMLKYVNFFKENKVGLVSRAVGFSVLLSLKQNEPEVAMSLVNELVQKSEMEQYISFNCYLLALIELERYDEAINILQHELPKFKRKKSIIFTDVMGKLAEGTSKNTEGKYSHFKEMKQRLHDEEYCSFFSFEEYLTLPAFVPGQYAYQTKKSNRFIRRQIKNERETKK